MLLPIGISVKLAIKGSCPRRGDSAVRGSKRGVICYEQDHHSGKLHARTEPVRHPARHRHREAAVRRHPVRHAEPLPRVGAALRRGFYRPERRFERRRAEGHLRHQGQRHRGAGRPVAGQVEAQGPEGLRLPGGQGPLLRHERHPPRRGYGQPPLHLCGPVGLGEGHPRGRPERDVSEERRALHRVGGLCH